MVVIPLQQSFQVYNETQGLEGIHFPEVKNETAPSSSSSLIPCTMEEVSTPGTHSTSQDPWSAYTSSIVSRAMSISKSDEGSSNQEMENTSTLKSLPGTENLPIDSIDEQMELFVNFRLLKFQINEPHQKGRHAEECHQKAQKPLL